MPGGDLDRTNALGEFLRLRREQVPPERAGLPPGGRRRSPGLRREEVAVLAGISPTWYAYLEQGRPIRPSAESLESIARVLELTDDERRYLFRLALGRPPAEASSSGLPATEIEAALAVIGDSPHPVYVVNPYTDVIAWNEAAGVWYTDFARLPEDRRNMLRWMLTDPEARERIVGWEQDTRDIVARLHAAWAVRSGDPRLNARVRELAEVSPEFRTWWDEHVVREPRSRERVLRAPGLGTRRYRIVAMRFLTDDFTSAVVHVPAR